MKRIFDLSVAVLLIIMFFPILAVVAILIRFKLGSPVVFKQQRPGLNEKPFNIYKFRTMTDKRDSAGNLLSDEVRLTSFGKILRRLSLDELPQLINVVKGELSLVGPRPLLMEYLPLYSVDQAKRHNVKPGITGWAQVNGRNAISWEEKFQFDVWYVENYSFSLDMKILWMTVVKVIKRVDVSQHGHVTMEKFRGNEKWRDC